MTGETGVTYRGHTAWVRRGLAWSPDGMRIASGAWDRTVQVWEAFSGKTLLTYRGHAGIVYAVAWSADGKYIASGGGAPDGTVQVWHADTGEQVLLYRGHCIYSQSVHGVTWSPDGTRLASVQLGSGVRVWDAMTGQDLLIREYSKEPLAWSPDGRFLISTRTGGIEQWDADIGQVLTTHADRQYEIHALGWSSDGTRIAAGGYDQVVKVWEAAIMEKAEEE